MRLSSSESRSAPAPMYRRIDCTPILCFQYFTGISPTVELSCTPRMFVFCDLPVKFSRHAAPTRPDTGLASCSL